MADTINENDVPVKELLQRFEESKIFRKNYESKWADARKMYNGEQWDGIEKVAWYQSEPVYNKIFEFIELHRAYLADNKWGVDVIPAGLPKSLIEEFNSQEMEQDALAPTQELMGTDPSESFFDMLDKVNALLDFLWGENRMKSKLSEVILYMFLYGTGFLKATYDPDDYSSGLGGINTQVVSPIYIFPDPNATSVHDASYIIEHHPVTYRWIIEHYPDKAMEVKNKGLGSTTEWFEAKGDRPAGSADVGEAKRVDILECWYSDSTIAEDAEGEPELSFPNGRMTLMTTTGVILEDKPNPYTTFPYVRFVEIPRPAEFFGDCTVNKVMDIQVTINQILRTIIDNGLWIAHGIWVADTTSGITPDGLAGYAPRDVIVKNPGTDVHLEGGQMLPSHLFEMLNQQDKAFDRVAGTPDVLRGIVPSRQPVGTVEMQQEAGEARTRERQRRVEEALEDLGSLWLDIAAEYWSDKRIIRNKRMMGGFDMFEMSKKDLQEWKFDVQVVPGSTSPTNIGDQLNRAFDLIERGGVQIPPTYLVELAQLPGLYSAMAQGMEDEEPEVPAGGEAPIEGLPFPEEGVSPEVLEEIQPQMPQADVGAMPMQPDAAMGLPPEMLPAQ